MPQDNVRPCPHCGGSGEVRDSPACTACGGKGYRHSTRSHGNFSGYQDGQVRIECGMCRGTGYQLEAVAPVDRQNDQRTVADVAKKRQTVQGCCNRFADYKACDCLEVVRRHEAASRVVVCPECRNSGYAVHPQNGWVKGQRCSRGCPVSCSICNDPNCNNPNGQH